MRETDKKRISVMGDSISTFEGYNPFGYAVYYRDDVSYENDLTDVGDTWWMRVIEYLGGRLCVNNSFSGSFVSGFSPWSACSVERCSALGDDPDIVLVYMGTNDRGLAVGIDYDKPEDNGNFYGAYTLMLKRIASYYPKAKIVCATLPLGYLKGEDDSSYGGYGQMTKRYNEAIRAAVKAKDCFLADVAKNEDLYETLDHIHPTKEGHRRIASLWAERLKSLGL